jgi:hypothetical protein
MATSVFFIPAFPINQSIGRFHFISYLICVGLMGGGDISLPTITSFVLLRKGLLEKKTR